MEEEKGKMKNVGIGETRKAVYLFFCNIFVPYNHTLYAVDLPNNLEGAPLNSGPVQLSPILAFKSEEYPDHMSCVEVEGKLYFVGGGDWNTEGFYPQDVYIFDPLTASLDKPLTKGPKMNTGKCNPLAFVVGRDIYVLSQWKVNNLSTFEVLRADASGHYVEWEILEEPPLHNVRISGHVVIGERIFLSDSYRFYDTVSRKWSTSNLRTVRFSKRAYFVDDHLYSCFYPYVVSSYESIDLRQSEAFWSLRICDGHLRPPMPYLTYIGERCFCHVLFGSPLDPDRPGRKLLHNRVLGLTLFKAFTDRYSEGEKTYFRCDLLHCMHFANKNISSGEYFLEDCFVLPSCGIKPSMEEETVFSRCGIKPAMAEETVFSRVSISERLKLRLGLLPI